MKIKILIFFIALCFTHHCSDDVSQQGDNYLDCPEISIDKGQFAAGYQTKQIDKTVVNIKNIDKYYIIKLQDDSISNLNVTDHLKIFSRFSIGRMHYYKCKIDDETVLKKLKQNKKVYSLEPLRSYRLFNIPDDPALICHTYIHETLNLFQAWEITKGNTNIEVSVFDSGINGLHEDLQGQLLEGWSYIDNSGFTDETPLPAHYNGDYVGHGSHVAGIIAAKSNNSVGIFGIAPECNLRTFRLFNSYGYSTTDELFAKALIRAADNNTPTHRVIINMSFGGTDISTTIQDAILYALHKGCIITAASGNESSNLRLYPAAYSGVIAVGATRTDNQIADFSTRGKHISVCAPGVDILSCSNLFNSSYFYDNGTSMSTPVVSGVIALLLSLRPELDLHQVKTILEQSATDMGEIGYDDYYGYGIVNAYQTLVQPVDSIYGSLIVNVSQSGNPVNGVLVTLSNSEHELEQTALTTATSINGLTEGIAYFPAVKEGNYNIHCVINNVTKTESVSITSNSTLSNPQETSISF